MPDRHEREIRRSMNMNKIMKARKGGFTLVELLIVIIIIAILAGMMMLTTGSATDRAEATKVISNLRNMKAAALMYYVDNKAWPIGGTSANTIKSLEKYLDRSIDTKFAVGTVGAATAEKIYIGFTGVNTTLSAGVRDKLAQSAVDSGLFTGTASPMTTNYTASSTTGLYVPMK